MSDLLPFTDPKIFAVVAQSVTFRYQRRLKSVSEDALSRALELAQRLASIRTGCTANEILPALVACAISELSASTESFATSSSRSQHAIIAREASAIDAEVFGTSCSRGELLDLLAHVHEAMTAGASEAMGTSSHALEREIEKAIGTEPDNDARIAALFADISELLDKVWNLASVKDE